MNQRDVVFVRESFARWCRRKMLHAFGWIVVVGALAYLLGWA